MDNMAQYTHENAGPFEMWRNPHTGHEEAFATFPVVSGRFMSETVYLTDKDEYGRSREWEVTYKPAIANEPASIYVWGNTPLPQAICDRKPGTAVEEVCLTDEGEPSDGRWLAILLLIAAWGLSVCSLIGWFWLR